ncbi:MAG: hypothetical protein Q4G69_14690 [Planctomycetia bacterium]|nr:hypothetical protein [Planctomycetia bacterium]
MYTDGLSVNRNLFGNRRFAQIFAGDKGFYGPSCPSRPSIFFKPQMITDVHGWGFNQCLVGSAPEPPQARNEVSESERNYGLAIRGAD